jgi:hypothetical protein
MKLTNIEKKQFSKIRKQINELATLDSLDELNEFFEEDIDIRKENIGNLLELLKQEKSMLKDLQSEKKNKQ